jgi:hypothetical protein
LLVPFCERTLELWLRPQRRCPLLGPDSLVRGFAQRGLERNAEMRAHAALLLLTDGVRERKADSRQRSHEQCHERDCGAATEAHLVGMAGHARHGRERGSHPAGGVVSTADEVSAADSTGAVGADSAVAVPAAFAAVTSTRSKKWRSSVTMV